MNPVVVLLLLSLCGNERSPVLIKDNFDGPSMLNADAEVTIGKICAFINLYIGLI